MNKKKLFLIINILLILFISSFSGLKASASAVTNMTLYTQYDLDIRKNESKTFQFAIPENKFYYIRIQGKNSYEISVETINYNCCSTGSDIFFEFKDVPGIATIKIKCLSVISDKIEKIVVRDMLVSLIGFNYGKGDIDTRDDLNVPYKCLNKYMNVLKHEDKSDVIYYLYYKDYRGLKMLNSPVLFFSGHGNETELGFPESGGINASFLPELSDNKITILSSCKGAFESGNNKCIARKFVEKGAKSSIGWPTEIAPSTAKTFCNFLFEYLTLGCTIQQAALNAKQHFLIGRIKNYKIFGNPNTKIVDSSFSSELLENKTATNKVRNLEDYYVEQLSDDVYRLYKKCNNFKSSEYLDCIKMFDEYYCYNKSDTNLNNKQILAINYSFSDSITYKSVPIGSIVSTETEIIYVIDGDVVIPVQYVFVEYKNNNTIDYMEYLLNLNNCKELSYEEYGLV